MSLDRRPKARLRTAIAVTLWTCAAGVLFGGLSLASPLPRRAPEPSPAPTAPGPARSLLMTQAQFLGDPIRPGPARLTIYRTDGQHWSSEVIEDPESNVFHQAIDWRGGILTIGAMKARLTHWKREAGGWKPAVLWERSWGGRFDRMRDLAIADLDGDGIDEIALATHDMGVVAVGDENVGAGSAPGWTFQEFGRQADTFVHEVEAGDVDGDGTPELYATPAERNRVVGAPRPGGVDRYVFQGGSYVRSAVVWWKDTHAKEILVTDLDGDGVDELYAAIEARVEHNNGIKTIRTPEQIVRLILEKDDTWREQLVFEMDLEKQCRFLLPGDANNDGKRDIVAAGMETGLWLLERRSDGTFEGTPIDPASGGYEHASLVADLDGDGRQEVYAASENHLRELHRYDWVGNSWKKTKIDDIPTQRITWSLQPGPK